MKKIFILCCAVFTVCIAHAQWPNVSTGISTSGTALSSYTQDPNWYLGTPNPISTTATYVQPFLTGTWNPTPVSITNAGWINPSTTPGNDVPGVYAFERKFTIYPNTCTFTTNFKIAEDDSLVSLELIPPTGPPIPLTVVLTNHVNPQYFLSQLIKKKITCPKTGEWRIRARIHYIDDIGGFLLSGRIDTTANGCTCCDSTCKLNLIVGGITGSPFSCGNTIKLKCNNNYDFNPHLDCKDTGIATSIISITLTDASTLTPAWATTFIANNGAGSLFIPSGIPSGIYTLTYSYGINGRICGTCKFKLNIQCNKPCNCTLTDSVTINGVNTALKCGDTVSLQCKTKYKFKRKLKCTGDTLTQITAVSVHDGNGNTPLWANTFITNLGNGILNVPNNISGIFSITYYWGSNGSICDSCTYYLNISCCRCSLNLTYDGPAGFGSVHCADTITAYCGKNIYLTPQLVCDNGSSQLIGFTLTDAANNTPSWASGFTGTGALVIPAGVSGIFTLTYIWGGADGVPCGSCKVFLKVLCCPPSGCTITATVSWKPGIPPVTAHCADTLKLICHRNYSFAPHLSCNGDSTTHVIAATLTDAFNNTPSWATTFLANYGSGVLPIPSMQSGIYALNYVWGVGNLLCGSCKMYLKITCCDSVKVSAGPDLTVCCTSPPGVQLNATPTGGVAPYTYSWSPATGLNFTNIANPLSTSTGTYAVTITDAFGCVATDTVKIIYSGVNCCRIVNNKARAQAYPNPFTNGFTLKIPANTVADVQVIDLHGMVLERQSKANGSLEMGKKLAYGVYTIVITYNDGTKEQIKVIKNSR